ncbi:MAG: CYTH domain-containing protein [Eubacteriaceae bacterium]|nr:CYTH domain-containing protein [Eubacteriaceae bacterium]
MEIELKYMISDPEVADRIWEDSQLKSLEEKGSRGRNAFNGTYFDTEDHILFKNDIAFRLREEGKKLVASLKWNGENQGPLHKREELNINLGEGKMPETPDPTVFSQSDEGIDMMDLLGEKELKCMMQVNVLRKSFRVDMGDSIVEISLDDGEIITEDGKEPVCELEIELFSGEETDLIKLGEQLQERYDLKPEKDSKFARGLKLLGMI